jgi:hypothetical protein
MTPERDDCTDKTVVALIDATLAADTTSASTGTEGFRAATLILSIGIGGIVFDVNNKIEFVLTHSDDNATWVNVTDTDLIKDANCPASVQNGIIRSLTAAHAAADVQKLGYIGGKPYLELKADFSGVHGTGTPITANLILEQSRLEGAA